MNIKFKRMKRSSPDYPKVKSLYKTAFPPAEQAPFALLSLKRQRAGADFWGIYKDDSWAGLMYVVSNENVAYIFYFAIDSSQRGGGIGSAALQLAKKAYSGKRLFLAIEQLDDNAPNADERIHRRNFYMRNGFMPLGTQLREASVVYDLLGTGGKIEPQEYKSLMEDYMGKLFSRLVTMEILN